MARPDARYLRMIGDPSCGLSTSPVEPLRNADDQGEHRRHAFLLYGEALLHRTEPDLHRAEPALHRSEAAFHRGEAMLQVADFGC